MLADANTTGVVAYGISDLDDVAAALAETEPESESWQREERANLSRPDRIDR